MVVNGIAIIGSGWEDHATSSAVLAINIANGSLKWKKKFNNQGGKFKDLEKIEKLRNGAIELGDTIIEFKITKHNIT